MITKDMLIKEMFFNYPDKTQKLGEIMAKHGVKCMSCCASAWESIEEGLKGHGMTDKEIDEILDELNTAIK